MPTFDHPDRSLRLHSRNHIVGCQINGTVSRCAMILTSDQIDGAAQDLLEPPLHPEEVEEADGLVEVNEQIDVAVRAGLAAGDRTEHVE